MGMILEFYRLSDEKIRELKELSEQSCVEYLEQSYTSVHGIEHKEGDAIFYLDKTWDVIRFLLVEAEKTEVKVLTDVYGEPLNKSFDSIYNFLLSEKVKAINQALQEMHPEDILLYYDEEKMQRNMVYSATNFHKDLLKTQIAILKQAFKKSANSKSGLIISIG